MPNGNLVRIYAELMPHLSQSQLKRMANDITYDSESSNACKINQ